LTVSDVHLRTLGRHEADSVAAAQGDSIDYRSIIESTLAGLTQNTPAARQDVYTHARAELCHQLSRMALPQPVIELETLALDLTIRKIERQWQVREAEAHPRESAIGTASRAPALLQRAAAPLLRLSRFLLPRRRSAPGARFRPIGLAAGLLLGAVAVVLAVVAYHEAAYRTVVEGPVGRWFLRVNVAAGDAVPPTSGKAADRLPSGRAPSPAIDPQSYHGPTPVHPLRAEFSIASDPPAAVGAGAEVPAAAAADTPIAAPGDAAGLPAWLANYAAIGSAGAILTQPAQQPIGGPPPAVAMAIPEVPPALVMQPVPVPSREVAPPAAAAAKPLPQANAKVMTLIDGGKRAVAKGDLDRAVGMFTEAIRLDPKYPEGYAERGQANFKLGETDRAIADYSAAIQRDPQFGNALRSRGMAYLYRGSTDLALADLTRAIELAENDGRLMAAADLFYARRSRASIYNSKHQYDREIAECTALVQSYMNDPAVVESLKANYGDAGAANILATIYRQRAAAALHLSDSESAIADLTDAIPLSSDRGYSALIDRARIHESRGERIQAIADLQTALDVRPGSDEARLGLKRLGASPASGAPRGM
jgi:tetratricopeptide (TPR) repeat protein